MCRRVRFARRSPRRPWVKDVLPTRHMASCPFRSCGRGLGMDDRTDDKRWPKVTAAGAVDRKQGKARSDDVPRGIVCMVIATILFAGASAASKWLVGIYPVGEVLCLRSFASLIAVSAMVLPVSGLCAFVTHRPCDHLARGLSQSISQLCLLLAFSLMPLAGAVAINFSAPLFAAVVSIIWLKEPASLVRGAALVIGFVGD